jgi:thymidylate kinase
MMAARVIVSLSGAVGSGKSTTSRAVVELLRAQGRPAEHVRFQDFVALRFLIDRRRAPRPERGGNGGSLSRSEGTRRHDYRLRPLTLSVTAGYLLRSMLFRVALRRWPKETILVFDRYFYDSLVHFDLERAGLLLEVLRLAIPVPSIAGLLLIPEQTLRDRRSYYSADYARLATIAYERLAARFVWLVAIRTSAGMPFVDASKLVGGLLEQRPNDGASV